MKKLTPEELDYMHFAESNGELPQEESLTPLGQDLVRRGLLHRRDSLYLEITTIGRFMMDLADKGGKNMTIDESKLVHLHRHEKQLAFSIAFVLLKIDPTPLLRDELTTLCETQKDLLETVVAIRDTGLEAALKLLRARHAARGQTGHA
jgi:hypothetical protein